MVSRYAGDMQNCSKGKKEKLQMCSVSQSVGLGLFRTTGIKITDSCLRENGVLHWKSASVISTQGILMTMRRVWASRAIGQLHASMLGFREEIWGRGLTHTATKRMPRITYRKWSIHGASTTNTQGPLTFLTDDVTLRSGGGAGSCLNPWGLVCQKVGVG